jgi:hypothetical protein
MANATDEFGQAMSVIISAEAAQVNNLNPKGN